MPFCERCNVAFHGMAWLGKYCSLTCAREDNRKGWKDCAPLYDPTDPNGERAIAKNRDETDAMIEAAAIHPQLPRIIMLRKRGKTQRDIAAACNFKSKTSVTKILKKAPCNLLRECGLHIK